MAQQYQMEAQVLRDAMKKAGTDEKMIIQVASCRNFLQREQISKTFLASFGIELENEFKKELSGNFQKLISAVFKNRHAFWAEQVFQSFKGVNNDKRLIQLVLLMSDRDIPEISKQFQLLFNQNFVGVMNSELGKGDWQRLLKAWVLGQHATKFDVQQACDDLYKAAQGKGTDEDVFIKILANATHECYNEICLQYQKKYFKSVKDLMKEEFSMNSRFAFVAAHEYLINPLNSICSVIFKAFDGAGTDDTMLIAATALFADYYRGEPIRAAYKEFGDFVKDIKGDTSGNYEKTLLAMWGCSE